MELNGKIALVTGAAKRLGKAIALALSEHGANIVVHFHSSEREAKETSDEIRANGVQAIPICADLTNELQVQQLMEKISETFGRLDILVNSASIFKPTPFNDLTAFSWREIIEANLNTVFLCSRCAADLLRNDRGVIVNISDTSAWRPWTDYLPYCVSKAGVIALTHGLARILAPEVRVNCIALGTILPPEHFDSGEWTARMTEKILLKRIGSVEDVVKAVLFCIACDYLTGAVIPLDGGRFLK